MLDNGGYVALSMRNVLTDYINSCGKDASALLGPRPTVHADEPARYPISQFAEDLKTARCALEEPLIGLKAGQTVQPHHLGVLGYVVQHCRNLAEAQLRLERYLRLVYDGAAMNIEMRGNEMIIRWGMEHGYVGADTDDFFHAVLVAYTRSLVGQRLNPSRVEFVNPRPANTRPYDAFFGCPVQFEAEETRIGVHIGDLQQPVLAPNDADCARLDREASRELSQLPTHHDIEGELRDALVGLIRRNEARLETLAESIHCSVRTLQRRLAKSGRNFQDMLDRLRFEMATMYMARPELELVDVALLCGFAEHSAFTRAFTRWTGEPPSQYRQKQTPSADQLSFTD